MGKSVNHPKKHIISCRISDRELEILQQRAEACAISISELLRQSLDLRGTRAAGSTQQAA